MPKTVQQKERRRIYQRRSRARKRELEKKIEEEIEKEFVEKLEETPKEEESDLVDPRSSPPTTTTSRSILHLPLPRWARDFLMPRPTAPSMPELKYDPEHPYF
ncbi:hypothetical protein TKK_0014583 [Trichogramma kaykai]